MFVETIKNSVESFQKAALSAQETAIKSFNDTVWPTVSAIEKFDLAGLNKMYFDAVKDVNPFEFQKKFAEAFTSLYK